MALAFGEKTVTKAYFGAKVVSAIYLGTKKVFPDEEEELPGTGDIRLRIETTKANQSFSLFYRIKTEEGGYVSIDWGDGNTETLTGATTYKPTHTYATAGEYVVKLTGSKFTGVNGITGGSAYNDFKDAVREILSLKMPNDSTGVSLSHAFSACDKLIGSIPEWGANITDASYTYNGCRGLTGNIPEWGANITNADATYGNCSGLTGCSTELLQDPMPSRITSHADCVYGCVDEIRKHFTPDWGGTKEELPGTGDIRLRIETTKANQSFPLFYHIMVEVGGYISIDWGDGNTETLTGKTTYQPTHTYATAGEYVVKLTGSKFTEVGGSIADAPGAVREILSLKMPTDSTSVSLRYAFYGCSNLTGNIPAWDDCITDANNTYNHCKGLTGSIPEWGANITNASTTYSSCKGLTGSIPEWGPNITDANSTYSGCSGLTGNVPEWGANITDASYTYNGCTGLTGNIPEWGAEIWHTYYTYSGCTGLTGNVPEWGASAWDVAYTYYGCKGLTGRIPKWGANIVRTHGAYQNCIGLTGNIPAWGARINSAGDTYNGCSGLTGCSKELLQDPMPSRITHHYNCVSGCVDEIRKHFTLDWGGMKVPVASGDIRLRIKVTANQSFPLFYKIATGGGFVCVDWGDGNEEMITDTDEYSLEHIYAKTGEYVVKLTGSKFAEVGGTYFNLYDTFRAAVLEILSLKMPTDSTDVSLRYAFYGCTNLIGSIPAWDDCITDTDSTYWGCTGLTGSIPAWGANIDNAEETYQGCTGLTGSIPEWGVNITNTAGTYKGCKGLTGSIPAWGANITDTDSTYWGCTGLTGSIPAWGENITSAYATYQDCIGLTGCSGELFQDPMPSRITSHADCVTGCVDAIRQHFTPEWGGTPSPAEGDIRLRIETTIANQLVQLFTEIRMEKDGYVSVDWGDGDKATYPGDLNNGVVKRLSHNYATAGEYVVKLTGSKFYGISGADSRYDYSYFQDALREILSLKMPKDSTRVYLHSLFSDCTNLTGNIPAWDNCITDASYVYAGCTGLTGWIPKWGANMTGAHSMFKGCSGLTGNIPEWGANITDATYTYYGCSGLTGCSKELLQDPMPSRMRSCLGCVSGCADEIRQHFTPKWGGTKTS